MRAGLVMPLLGEGEPQSLLGVLTRDRGRRFSEEDVDELHGLVEAARPPISRALNLREADVVPELDMLTSLLDRQSFYAVLEREILRARLAHHPLALLVIDVDRLTWLNARIGILSADGVLLELADRLRAVVHRLDYAFRLGGGQFAVVRPGSEGGDARGLFEAFRDGAREQPDRRGRARLGLGRHHRARAPGRRRVVRQREPRRRWPMRSARAAEPSSVAESEDAPRRTNGTLHIAGPSGEIVVEG